MTNQKRVTKSSVAAFVLLPQFSLSTRVLREQLIPIFKLLLLTILSSRCLPAGYAEKADVRTLSVSRMMGDAWYHLRTSKNAGVMEWGFFTSLLMLFAFMFASVASLILKFLLGWGQVAHAQIFAHPGNPYSGAAANDTSLTAVQTVTAPGGVIFDKQAYGAGGTSTDYALMLLDKVLRQPALGTGGSMQNALSQLIMAYNTGILVVAAVMMVWMIISIVADTAAAGKIGGGRHNLVWTPVRVIFALGIMIPLGNSGFSSGQFAVMKLAEWGSNFGSEAWDRYMSAVVVNQNILAPYNARHSPANVASTFARIKVCQVAYNAVMMEQGDPDQRFLVRRIEAGHTEGNTSYVWEYTNETTQGICGSIEFSQDQASTPSHAAQVAEVAQGQLQDVQTPQYHRAVRDGIITGFWAMEARATDFACAYVGKHMQPNDGSPNPVLLATDPLSGGTMCNAGQLSACGATNGGTPDARFPTAQCIRTMTSDFQGALSNAVTSNIGILTGYVGGGLVNDLRSRGWAGMGIFHLTIQQLNNAVQSYAEPGFSFTPATVNPNTGAWQDIRSSEILDDFDRWWPVATRAEAVQDRTTTELQLPKERPPQGFFGRMWNGAKSLWNDIARSAMAAGGDKLFFDLVEPDDPNTYPLAELARTGNEIVMWGLGLLGGGAVGGIPIVGRLATGAMMAGAATATDGGVGLGTAVGAIAGLALSGPISSFMKTAGWMVFAAGMFMSYYIPILPFIRVAFAVLTWIVSVFEAVVMLPLAALTFLDSQSAGLGSGAMRGVWILWLNVLMRPVLVVAGFVGSILIFNSFVIFFQHSFTMTVTLAADGGNVLGSMIGKVVYTVVYVGLIYSAANTSLKLLDLLPDAMMRWMGGPGTDRSFDDSSTSFWMQKGLMMGALGGAGKGGGGASNLGQLFAKPTGIGNNPPPAGGGAAGTTPPAGGAGAAGVPPGGGGGAPRGLASGAPGTGSPGGFGGRKP